MRGMHFPFDRITNLWLLFPIGLVNVFVLLTVWVTWVPDLPRGLFLVPALMMLAGVVPMMYLDSVNVDAWRDDWYYQEGTGPPGAGKKP